jgi:DNA-binding CsgD family transcriptional regulator
MSRPSDDREFRELLPQVKRWHEGEAALRKIKRHLQQDPRNTLEAIFEVAEDCKLGWQMTLLWRFGVDAQTMTRLTGFKPPRSLVEAQGMILAGVLHTFWDRVLDAKAEALVALAADREPHAAMEKTVLEAFEELPATFGVIVEAAQNDSVKEWAATRLATWTDTQIKLGESRSRLNAALSETGSPPQQAKLLELLPASLVAFAEWRPDEPFRPGSGGKSYVSRAAGVLEKSGSEQAEKNENKGEKPRRLQYIQPEGTEEEGADVFELKGADELGTDPDMDAAENRLLMEVIERQTSFTARQRQVYEFWKKNYTSPEIADQLGIKDVTVRVLLKGARDAMLQTARELGRLRE